VILQFLPNPLERLNATSTHLLGDFFIVASNQNMPGDGTNVETAVLIERLHARHVCKVIRI